MQVNNIEGSSGLGRKITQNLSFNLGDTFSGEIVNSDDSDNSITIKMADGWKFPAKLENIQNFNENQAMKFEVIGFDEGKIVLDILPASKDDNSENENEESIVDILNDNGLAVEEKDISILSDMIKHDMPLTKKNVSLVKSLLDFKSKLEDDISNKDSFINNFLESNKLSSEETEKFNNLFEKFSYDLKDMSIDQILTMLENDIDITPQNVKSFDNIAFKFSTIYNDVNKLNNFLKNAGFKDAQETPMDAQKLLPNLTKMQYTPENANEIKDALGQASKLYDDISNISALSKTGEENTLFKNIKDLLVKYYNNGSDIKVNKENFKSVVNALNENKTSIEGLFDFSEKVSNFKETVSEMNHISVGKFEYTPENANKIKNVLGQAFKLYDDISSKDSREGTALNNIKNSLLKYYDGNDIQIDKENFNSIVKTLNENKMSIKKLFDFSEKISNFKETVSEMNHISLEKFEYTPENANKIKDVLGQISKQYNNISNIVVFSKGSEEDTALNNVKNSFLKYYHDDTQIDKENFNRIIKSLNENKESIEKLFYFSEKVSNFKETVSEMNHVSVGKFEYTPENANKIKNVLEQVFKLYDDISSKVSVLSKDSKECTALKNIKDSFLKYYNDGDIKVNKENFNKIINLFKENKSSIESLSNFSEKIQGTSEKSNSQFQNLESLKSNVVTEIKSKIGELENMLGKMKSISLESPDNKNTVVVKAFDGKKVAIRKEYLNNVISTLKENINDFKVFNQLSNNYYYLDVPLNVDKNKYNFRMIVKDNRHSGKKIDSKDVKFVLSLETTNIGIIDSYIRILSNSINVNIKCDRKWVNVFKSNLDRLKKILMDNYSKVYIDISKKEVKSNIVTINDFFDKNNISNIDVRV